MSAGDAFHQHLQACPSCRDNPAFPCAAGAILLMRASAEAADELAEIGVTVAPVEEPAPELLRMLHEMLVADSARRARSRS